VKCGSVIRLQHVATEKYLHSHHHAAPLSGNQEVSAYEGDKGMCLDCVFLSFAPGKSKMQRDFLIDFRNG
jgi:hypothetical protein